MQKQNLLKQSRSAIHIWYAVCVSGQYANVSEEGDKKTSYTWLIGQYWLSWGGAETSFLTPLVIKWCSEASDLIITQHA